MLNVHLNIRIHIRHIRLSLDLLTKAPITLSPPLSQYLVQIRHRQMIQQLTLRSGKQFR